MLTQAQIIEKAADYKLNHVQAWVAEQNSVSPVNGDCVVRIRLSDGFETKMYARCCNWASDADYPIVEFTVLA